MTTLADITLATARICAEVVDGVATGGSATTLVDNAVTFPNLFWNNGTIWLRSGNNIGKSAIITSYTSATWTYLFPTLTLLCAAADLYSVSGAAYPRATLVAAINQALLEMGQVTMEDLTSLTGVSATLEYSVPAGKNNITRVTVGVSPNFFINQHWDEINGKLRFAQNYQPNTGDEIHIYYAGPHPNLTADADVVNALLPLERLEWLAALYAMRARFNLVGPSDARLQAKINEATQRTEMLKAQYLPRWSAKDPRLGDLI